MKTKNIIKVLTRANKWRRGGEGEIPNPKIFGIAIDEAIRVLKSQDELINSMTQTKNSLIKKLKESDEILNNACDELQFSNMQKDFYKNILDEVEILLKKGVNYNLIQKAIENGKIRGNLDISIHFDLKYGIDNNSLKGFK